MKKPQLPKRKLCTYTYSSPWKGRPFWITVIGRKRAKYFEIKRKHVQIQHTRKDTLCSLEGGPRSRQHLLILVQVVPTVCEQPTIERGSQLASRWQLENRAMYFSPIQEREDASSYISFKCTELEILFSSSLQAFTGDCIRLLLLTMIP